jgi:hypothetical protein
MEQFPIKSLLCRMGKKETCSGGGREGGGGIEKEVY